MTLELDNSQEYNHNNSSKSKSKYQKKEHKWKELLYNLFYEIKSEILNTKLEIEEDEYQENINSTTIPQLVNYIHDSIQILLKKKIEDSKEEQKEIDKKYYLDKNLKSPENQNKINIEETNFLEYESIIKNLESKQRILTKNVFQQKLQIDAMENKIEEYMEMEDEFEEMKTKLKYEDGRFLNNDRKDNEILIIRGENSILKNEINKLEEKVKSLEEEINKKDLKIEEINKELENLKNKFDEKQNEANTAPSININISNVHSNSNINNNNNEINNMNNNETDGGNLIKKNIYNPNRNSSNFITNSKFFYNYVNEQISINNKKNTFSSKKKKEKTEKMNHKNYYRNKTSKDKKLLSQKIKTKLLNNKNNICDLLSTTRNESLDRAKQDLLNKYLIGIKGNKNIMNLNNSCMKVNSLTGKIYYKKSGNNNMNNIQIQSNKKNNNDINSIRSKSNSNKTKPPSASQSHNNVISYRSVS
jgi:hypothetical protein